jgi:sugar lactone lactonase YvrE
MDVIKTDRYSIYKPNVDPQHPYPGLYSFQETDSKFFYGRKKETQDLLKLIENNTLTIIFGKSGVGKTSLLRAGLMPKLRERYYLPIYLRIDFGNEKKTPIAQTRETIQSKIKELDPSAPAFEDMTLWEYFSFVKILKGYVKPLLFFDQFEEMFTTGRDNLDSINEFVTGLADLVENRVPVPVREKLEKQKKTVVYKNRGLDFRVILSLREDYLPQFESLYRYIPSMRHSRYRVLIMMGKNAVESVTGPAKNIIKDPEVGVEIVEKIPGAKRVDYKPFESIDQSWKTKKIEPFLLSLFCYRINEKRLEANAKEITHALIKNIKTEDIIKTYYEESINRFPPNVKIAIEDLLLTPDGYRKLQDINALKTGYGVTDRDIERLVDRRIIRKETRQDIDYVELIHDVLAPLLKQSRDNRLEEERKKKEAAVRRKRNRRIFAAAAAVIFVILAGLTGIALDQKARTKVQEQRAKAERRKADEERRKRFAYEWAAYSIDVLQKDRDLGFRLAEQAYKMDKTILVARKALLSVFYNGEFYREFVNKDSEFSKTVSEKADFFADFSPEGDRVLTVTSKQAILWNFDGSRINGGEIRLQGGLEFKPNASFSPDGKTIAFCTKADDRIILWNLEKNEFKPVILPGGVRSLAFSPDISRGAIIIASRDKKIRLFDLTGKLLRTFEGHTQDVNTADFSPDGRYIVTAGWDTTVRRWALDGNQIGAPFEDNSGAVNTADFSPGGHRVVTGSMDGIVRLWDLQTGSGQIFGAHKGAVTSAVFSPGGEYILTGSEDKTVRLLSLNRFLVIEFKEFNDIVHAVSFSRDGKYILIAPARGPAQLRLVCPDEIIRIVNEKGKVRQLSEDEKETYNLRQDKTRALSGD